MENVSEDVLEKVKRWTSLVEEDTSEDTVLSVYQEVEEYYQEGGDFTPEEEFALFMNPFSLTDQEIRESIIEKESTLDGVETLGDKIVEVFEGVDSEKVETLMMRESRR